MKRLGRILLNATTVVSLVLCVATVALWVRSYWTADQLFDVRTAAGEYLGTDFVVAWRGRLLLQSGRLDPPADDLPGPTSHRRGYQAILLQQVADPDKSRGVATWAGFAWGRYPYGIGIGPPRTMRVVAVPLYALAITLFTPALMRVRARLNARRLQRRAGSCPSCGYDLRATPDRCPECGTVPNGM